MNLKLQRTSVSSLVDTASTGGFNAFEDADVVCIREKYSFLIWREHESKSLRFYYHFSDLNLSDFEVQNLILKINNKLRTSDAYSDAYSNNQRDKNSNLAIHIENKFDDTVDNRDNICTLISHFQKDIDIAHQCHKEHFGIIDKI